jgi:hypothetical protein
MTTSHSQHGVARMDAPAIVRGMRDAHRVRALIVPEVPVSKSKKNPRSANSAICMPPGLSAAVGKWYAKRGVDKLRN